ncbi:phosphoglycolate phosphatase [Sphingomonas sp. AP4-R1]|uniref:phosphoglycolate phosphatase n=1 Tax=Sphingomonas sp. AP4-R1 TaxID=2735134 RepID=UPI001493BF44|nr:phosphoglycolate phosphatase [Sphingomonas sp. AP4-R1]QJU58909.1 phosphoglycolate phosphatase [Sphingomonas sp. AP4-R1]
MASFPFDVVAFDLDGTLADTAPDLTAALNHTLVELGYPPVPAEDVRHMVGHGVRVLLRRGLAAAGVEDEAIVDRGFPIFLAYYEAHIADLSFAFPGCEAALDELAARGVTLAICTNKLESLARHFVTEMGWERRFSVIIGGDTVGVSKPDPAPLLATIERAGGGRAAFVGDSITDTTTALNAAIPCVALSFGFHDRPPAELGADLVIDHYDELIPALERLGG